MSGFVAIAHAEAPVEDSLVRRLTDVMSYCGRDGRNVWADGRTALGHALLSPAQPASEEEQQPATLDGRTWIAADAVLAGRGELVHELRATGSEIDGAAPDARLLLYAYAAWGARCVEHLVGDFAFAIWDTAEQRLFCARDHFGVVPLLYARTPDGFVVGNVLWAIRAHPAVSAKLDEHAIGDFLLFRANMDQSTTVFSDVRRVPPGHTLTIEGHELRVRRYWEPDDARELAIARPAEYVDGFRAVLDEAVSDRLTANGAGTHLSGGMDSTSIAATATHVLAERGNDWKLRAYTIVVERLIADDEGRYAALAATRLGIPAEQLVFEEYALRPPNGGWVFPEPAIIPSQSPEYEITRRTASFARALLVGFGGDPLFSLGGRWGPPARGWLDRARYAARMLRAGRSPHLGVRSALRARSARDSPDLPAIPGWINPSFARRTDLHARSREVTRDWRGATGPRAMVHPVWSWMFGLAHHGAFGLPCRTLFPFFDVRVARYVWQAPQYPWRADKHLLRLAMRDRLPPEVVRRPKTPLYSAASRTRGDDPFYRLALVPDARRARAELLSGNLIGDYVDVPRARALVDHPLPHAGVRIDACFPLAHWLHTAADAAPTTKEAPYAIADAG